MPWATARMNVCCLGDSGWPLTEPSATIFLALRCERRAGEWCSTARPSMHSAMGPPRAGVAILFTGLAHVGAEHPAPVVVAQTIPAIQAPLAQQRLEVLDHGELARHALDPRERILHHGFVDQEPVVGVGEIHPLHEPVLALVDVA